MASNYLLISNHAARTIKDYTPWTHSLLLEGSRIWCITKIALTAITFGIPLVLALGFDGAIGLKNKITGHSSPQPQTTAPTPPNTQPQQNAPLTAAGAGNFAQKCVNGVENVLSNVGGVAGSVYSWKKTHPYLFWLTATAVISTASRFGLAKPILQGGVSLCGWVIKSVGEQLFRGAAENVVEAGGVVLEVVGEIAKEQSYNFLRYGIPFLQSGIWNNIPTISNIWSLAKNALLLSPLPLLGGILDGRFGNGLLTDRVSDLADGLESLNDRLESIGALTFSNLSFGGFSLRSVGAIERIVEPLIFNYINPLKERITNSPFIHQERLGRMMSSYARGVAALGGLFFVKTPTIILGAPISLAKWTISTFTQERIIPQRVQDLEAQRRRMAGDADLNPETKRAGNRYFRSQQMQAYKYNTIAQQLENETDLLAYVVCQEMNINPVRKRGTLREELRRIKEEYDGRNRQRRDRRMGEVLETLPYIARQFIEKWDRAQDYKRGITPRKRQDMNRGEAQRRSEDRSQSFFFNFGNFGNGFRDFRGNPQGAYGNHPGGNQQDNGNGWPGPIVEMLPDQPPAAAPNDGNAAAPNNDGGGGAVPNGGQHLFEFGGEQTREQFARGRGVRLDDNENAPRQSYVPRSVVGTDLDDLDALNPDEFPDEDTEPRVDSGSGSNGSWQDITEQLLGDDPLAPDQSGSGSPRVDEVD